MLCWIFCGFKSLQSQILVFSAWKKSSSDDFPLVNFIFVCCNFVKLLGLAIYQHFITFCFVQLWKWKENYFVRMRCRLSTKRFVVFDYQCVLILSIKQNFRIYADNCWFYDLIVKLFLICKVSNINCQKARWNECSRFFVRRIKLILRLNIIIKIILFPLKKAIRNAVNKVLFIIWIDRWNNIHVRNFSEDT